MRAETARQEQVPVYFYFGTDAKIKILILPD